MIKFFINKHLTIYINKDYYNIDHNIIHPSFQHTSNTHLFLIPSLICSTLNHSVLVQKDAPDFPMAPSKRMFSTPLHVPNTSNVSSKVCDRVKMLWEGTKRSCRKYGIISCMGMGVKSSAKSVHPPRSNPMSCTANISIKDPICQSHWVHIYIINLIFTNKTFLPIFSVSILGVEKNI